MCDIVGGWGGGGGGGGSTEGNKLSLAGDLVSRHPSRVCLLLRVGDGSFPSELAPSMEQLCGCFASVVCVCKQSLKFLGSVVYGCSSAPLVVPYLCYVLVIAMACCFTVSVRALSYRIGCLFYVSPAWTQRPCAVRPTGSCSMLWSKDSVQRSKFVNWFLYRCGDLLELTQSQGPLSPFQVFGRWDLEALVAALSATLVMERNVPAIGGKSFELSDGEEGRLSHVEVRSWWVAPSSIVTCLSKVGWTKCRAQCRGVDMCDIVGGWGGGGVGEAPLRVISSPLRATWCLVIRQGSVCYSGLVMVHFRQSLHRVWSSCVVVLLLCVRALSYRIGCLFYVSPAWTQRPCAVRPTGSCSMLWSKDSVQRSKFVLKNPSLQGPLSPFQVFGRWDLEALVAALWVCYLLSPFGFRAS
ncbi:hypothetical protein Bca101_019087 [Brassica carinata]